MKFEDPKVYQQNPKYLICSLLNGKPWNHGRFIRGLNNWVQILFNNQFHFIYFKIILSIVKSSSNSITILSFYLNFFLSLHRWIFQLSFSWVFLQYFFDSDSNASRIIFAFY